MLKRVLGVLLGAILLAVPSVAQVPGGDAITIGRTVIGGGTNGLCLYDNSGKVGEQSCGGGTATDITVGTTTVTGAASGDLLTRGATALGKATPGTGVLTALGVNVGTAGSVVVNGGAGGTPSSLVGTNITGTAAGLTAGTASAVAVGGITGLGSGVGTFLATPSSTNLASAVTGETGTGALTFATNPVFTTSITLPSVAWASIPAAGNAGKIVRVSNVGTKGSLWMDDGTVWKAVNGQALLASLDAQSTTVSNSEVIKLQYQLPAAFWQVGDCARVFLHMAKSGTVDTGSIRVRVGTAGTTSDAAIIAPTLMAASAQSAAVIYDLCLEDATTLNGMTNPATGYGQTSTGTFGAGTTISNVSNALWISIGLFSGGTTNTVTLDRAQIYYISRAN